MSLIPPPSIERMRRVTLPSAAPSEAAPDTSSAGNEDDGIGVGS